MSVVYSKIKIRFRAISSSTLVRRLIYRDKHNTFLSNVNKIQCVYINSIYIYIYLDLSRKGQPVSQPAAIHIRHKLQLRDSVSIEHRTKLLRLDLIIEYASSLLFLSNRYSSRLTLQNLPPLPSPLLPF